ncbi:MAG: hypothetical protein ACPGUY_01830, partial [Akkermansiaceae bacterium]
FVAVVSTNYQERQLGRGVLPKQPRVESVGNSPYRITATPFTTHSYLSEQVEASGTSLGKDNSLGHLTVTLAK